MGAETLKLPPTSTLERGTRAQGQFPAGVEPTSRRATLLHYFQAMTRQLGPMHWWPARTPFEVIVGAILTQNTAWANVERAIANLKQARLLSVAGLEGVPVRRLAKVVRPSGYFRQKAKKLKAFLKFLRQEYGGSLRKMFRTPTEQLREKLLAVHGIGPETADSILLYAGGHAVFVVDAYTKRILQRHGWVDEKAGYEEVRAPFEGSLPRDVQLWNEYHALLVNVGKNWCRTKEAKCDQCPLQPFLPAGSPGNFVRLNSRAEKRNDRAGDGKSSASLEMMNRG